MRYLTASSPECRSRKIKCDEQKPECGQCLKTGRSCRILDSLFKPHSYSFMVTPAEKSSPVEVQKSSRRREGTDARSGDGVSHNGMTLRSYRWSITNHQLKTRQIQRREKMLLNGQLVHLTETMLTRENLIQPRSTKPGQNILKPRLQRSRAVNIWTPQRGCTRALTAFQPLPAKIAIKTAARSHSSFVTSPKALASGWTYAEANPISAKTLLPSPTGVRLYVMLPVH